MAVVNIIQHTDRPEWSMAFIARVSNPAGQQDNPHPERLLKYCIRHQHWSVFEHATLTLEINTTLAIATQLLRHRSFTFQQFSQRYADPVSALPLTFEQPHLRMQDAKNRQNSLDTLEPNIQNEFSTRIATLFKDITQLYTDMVDAGIAKECARGVLPQATKTRVYMTGNCRNWIHYIQLRTGPETQAEHRNVALQVKSKFCEVFPTVASALGWGTLPV
jgi:thymidylate synthase (FAD)